MIYPPEPIYLALRGAAVKHRVPITLLMGVAWAESNYNPKAVGPKTAEGWSAQGLMQLSPQIIKRYNVTDPFDPVQSADAAAQLLANLGKPLKWVVDSMLAAYNWGAANVASGKTWPKSVFSYITKVKSARNVYEDQATPQGATLIEQLNNAITALHRLNPGWPPAQLMLQQWSAWYATHKDDNAVQTLGQLPVLKNLWASYKATFERAPITDNSTPLPAKIEPDLWAKANGLLRDGKAIAADAADLISDIGKGIETLGSSGALGLIALLIAFAIGRSGRS